MPSNTKKLIKKWDKWDKPTGSVGNLLPSMAIKFMNGEDEVQAGEQGEIWIKGPNICKGYYKNPKATAESINREGWYRTGDVGYIDRHSNIFITDRMKELIKYNGYQVSPAQLEGLLLGHPAVNDVAVIGVYSKEKATELPRAYVMVAKGYASGKELEIEIIKWMGEKVSPYKRLRGGIRFVDVIPKSAAGKVLRKVLVEKAKMEELQFAGRAKM
jgi:acyl-CoA synthetase (AMP-forming)/AMP-acid ligase II